MTGSADSSDRRPDGTDAHTSADGPQFAPLHPLVRAASSRAVAADLAAEYRESTDAAWRALQSAVRRSSREQVVEVAHRLAGSAGMIGASRVARAAAAVERLATRGASWTEVRDATAALGVAIGDAELDLRELIGADEALP